MPACLPHPFASGKSDFVHAHALVHVHDGRVRAPFGFCPVGAVEGAATGLQLAGQARTLLLHVAVLRCAALSLAAADGLLGAVRAMQLVALGCCEGLLV